MLQKRYKVITKKKYYKHFSQKNYDYTHFFLSKHEPITGKSGPNIHITH